MNGFAGAAGRPLAFVSRAVLVRALVGLTLVAAFVLANGAAAHASLQLLKPTPDSFATFSGNGGYSADGLGQNTTGGTVQAEVPGGSQVVQAYL